MVLTYLTPRTRNNVVATIASLAMALTLAGCGGGGSSGGAAGGGGGAGGGAGGGGGGPVAVASVTLPASSGIAFVGTAKTIPAVVKGADGSTLTDRTISWTSSNTAVGTVQATGAQGVATPLAAGATTVTATVEGVAATLALEVKAAPASLAEFKALLPHSAPGAGGFVVASDITPGYSTAQLDHLMKAWPFFTGFFPKTAGNHAEMYYTWDPELVKYAKTHFPECDSALAQLPGRLLLTCMEMPTNLSWLVAPNLDNSGSVPADYATALASLSQAFMDSIAPPYGVYKWPWLWEGLSFAFKSGDFKDGPYAMRALADPDRTAFKQALGAGTLLTLDALVDLTRTAPPLSTGTWYGGQLPVAEAQSSMLSHYLYRNYPAALKKVFELADAGTVTTSQGAFATVLSEIGKTAAQLDADYKAWGAAQ